MTQLRPRLARAAARRRDDRGALTIEMALIAPLLLVIALGVCDFGFAYKDKLSIVNSARAGARVGSSAATDSSADFLILSTVQASLGQIPDDAIDYIVIYKASAVGSGSNSSVGGKVPEACKTIGSATNSVGGHPNLCNVYSGQWLANTFDPNDPSAFSGTSSSGGCPGSRPDQAWCPMRRSNDQAGVVDSLGVYVQMEHTFVTGVFGDTTTIGEWSVMNLEPNVEA